MCRVASFSGKLWIILDFSSLEKTLKKYLVNLAKYILWVPFTVVYLCVQQLCFRVFCSGTHHFSRLFCLKMSFYISDFRNSRCLCFLTSLQIRSCRLHFRSFIENLGKLKQVYKTKWQQTYLESTVQNQAKIVLFFKTFMINWVYCWIRVKICWKIRNFYRCCLVCCSITCIILMFFLHCSSFFS